MNERSNTALMTINAQSAVVDFMRTSNLSSLVKQRVLNGQAVPGRRLFSLGFWCLEEHRADASPQQRHEDQPGHHRRTLAELGVAFQTGIQRLCQEDHRLQQR